MPKHPGFTRYLYKEPVGLKLPEASDIAREAVKTRMAEDIQKAVTMAEYRIGQYREGQWGGLFTLERRAKGKWEPVSDGDLLEAVVTQLVAQVHSAAEQMASEPKK